jgi:hypothetical protein
MAWSRLPTLMRCSGYPLTARAGRAQSRPVRRKGRAPAEGRCRLQRVAGQPGDRRLDDCLRAEVGDRELGIGRLAQLARDAARHQAHGEVVPVGAPKWLHEPQETLSRSDLIRHSASVGCP